MTRDVSDVTHQKHGLRFEKSQLVEFCRRKKVDFRLLAEALRQVSHVGGGADGKVIIERLCLSLPYVEKPFNSKVIKCFVPELRSCKCFSCFRIPIYELWVKSCKVGDHSRRWPEGSLFDSYYELWTFHVLFSYPYHGYVTLQSFTRSLPKTLGERREWLNAFYLYAASFSCYFFLHIDSSHLRRRAVHKELFFVFLIGWYCQVSC